VCIENLIRFDCVVESHNVSANGRADIPLAEHGCLALQVEEPRRMSDEDLKDELERLRKENAALKKGASSGMLPVSAREQSRSMGWDGFP
jgi:hypothetical protein